MSWSPHPYLKLFFGAVCIGLAPIFTRFIVEQGGVGSVAAGFWRMMFGVVGFGLMAFLQKSSDIKRITMGDVMSSNWGAIIAAGVFFGMDLTVWHLSFEYTSVANSTLIANLSSLFVPISGVIFFREKIRRSLVLGGLAAFTGAVCLIQFGNAPSHIMHEGQVAWGNWLALATAFCYTGYMLSTKVLSMKFPVALTMTMVCAVSAVFLLIASFLLGSQIVPTYSVGWLWIVLLGGVSQTIGQGLVANCLGTVPVSTSALLLLLAPVSSAVFAVLILNQNLAIGQAAGIALTVLGLATIARDRK